MARVNKTKPGIAKKLKKNITNSDNAGRIEFKFILFWFSDNRIDKMNKQQNFPHLIKLKT
jgi:hypothetical protein